MSTCPSHAPSCSPRPLPFQTLSQAAADPQMLQEMAKMAQMPAKDRDQLQHIQVRNNSTLRAIFTNKYKVLYKQYGYNNLHVMGNASNEYIVAHHICL